MTYNIANWRDGNPEGRARAGEMLDRYPSLTPEELSELLEFYNTAPAIDTALLTCEPLLVPKILQFESEQRRMLKHKARLGMLLTTITICFAAIVLGLISAI